jgi:hypothetical protein
VSSTSTATQVVRDALPLIIVSEHAARRIGLTQTLRALHYRPIAVATWERAIAHSHEGVYAVITDPVALEAPEAQLSLSILASSQVQVVVNRTNRQRVTLPVWARGRVRLLLTAEIAAHFGAQHH